MEAELTRLRAERDALEKDVRREWWTNHGANCLPYGDDGEMQCCALDFKRMPLQDLRIRVDEMRMRRTVDAVNEYHARKDRYTALLIDLRAIEKQTMASSDALIEDVNNGNAPQHEADYARGMIMCAEVFRVRLSREPHQDGAA